MSQAGLARISTGGGSAGPILTITGNDGVPETPIAGNFNLLTANTTVQFLGSPGTETVDFGLFNIILGSNPAGLPGGLGIQNVGLGLSALNAATSATGNCAIGALSMQFTTTGNSNTALGFESLFSFITGNQNTSVGALCLGSITTASFNVGVGAGSLQHVKTGNSNIAVGTNAGMSYLTTESSNIMIGNSGVLGESNIIRIGTQGNGSGQQNQCFLAGVLNTTSGRVVNITSPGAYPYATLITDYVIIVDTSSARTINLISSPVKGTTYRIKDNTGSAAANNITITPAAGNIDGSATFVINTNFGSVDVTYNGTQWNIM